MCGYNAGSGVQVLGPVLAALSPASLVFAVTNPVDAMVNTINSAELSGARLALVVGALSAGGLYTLLVYMVHVNMVRNFDTAVRKLAGTK